GVPTPEVLACDWSLARFPWPYTVARRLPGRVMRRAELTSAEREGLLEQMGHHLRLIHGVELRGYGNLVDVGGAYAGRSTSAWQALREDLDRQIRNLASGALTDEQVRRVEARVEDERGLFDVDQGVLVHGDFQ